MLEGYKILTVTHRHTQLQNISRYVLANTGAATPEQRLLAIKESLGIEELMYTATCNRVMYFFHSNQISDASFVQRFFKLVNPTLTEEELSVVKVYEGIYTMEHLFRVAASIDSLVVGEREILRQLRESYEQNLAWNITGDHIRMAMQATVNAAKDVYSNTRIGEKPISIVSLAIEQLLQTNISRDARILMVGAGQTNGLVAKFLLKHGFTNVRVFNRTIGKAEQIADMLGGVAHPFSHLAEFEGGFDCLIVCTGATEAVITPEMYNRLLNVEMDSKVVVDLSIPHNVAPEVVANNLIQYIEIEGLRAMAQENLSFREQEVEKAVDILTDHLREFRGQFRQRMLQKALRQVPDEIRAVREHAVNVVFKKQVDGLDENSRALLDQMLAYMEKQCIGIPMKAVKEVAMG